MGRTTEKIEQLESEIDYYKLLQENELSESDWHLLQRFIDLAETKLDLLTNKR